MKIGIDISQIQYKGTGVARFNEGLIRCIAKQKTRHEWIFFYYSFSNKLENKYLELIKNSNIPLVSFHLPFSLVSILTYRFRNLCYLILKNNSHFNSLDWFITSDCIEVPTSVKKTTIVHDLAFIKYPQTVHPSIIDIQTKRLNYVKKESKIVFADSKSTAQDLSHEYNISSDRIIVNYPGVENSLHLNSDNQSKILSQFNIPDQYLLFVGKREPRKNLDNLVKTFLSLLVKNPKLNLVILGPVGWGEPIKTNKNVHIYDFVSDDALATFYSHALCLVYPSFYEGFGYPVIEAMQYGCPVVASNTSSIPEITDGAALLFDPYNYMSIQETVSKLIYSSQSRKEMIEKGFMQAKKFTWQKYYNRLIYTLENYSS